MRVPTWLLGILAGAAISLGTWVIVAIQELRTDVAVTKTDVKYIRSMLDEVRHAAPTQRAAEREAMLRLLVED